MLKVNISAKLLLQPGRLKGLDVYKNYKQKNIQLFNFRIRHFSQVATSKYIDSFAISQPKQKSLHIVKRQQFIECVIL